MLDHIFIKENYIWLCYDEMLMETCIFILLVGFIDSFIHVFSTDTRITKLNKMWLIPSMTLQLTKEDRYTTNWLKYSIVLEIYGSSGSQPWLHIRITWRALKKILLLTWHLSDYFGLEREGNTNNWILKNELLNRIKRGGRKL